MAHLLEEIRLDVNFVKSHSLQPKWYKALKVVILVGFLAGYGCLFGLARIAAFLASFLLLMSSCGCCGTGTTAWLGAA